MPLDPKTSVTLFRIAAILFAFAGGISLLAAYEDPSRRHIAQTVMHFSLSIAFFMIARIRRKSIQPNREDSSTEPK